MAESVEGPRLHWRTSRGWRPPTRWTSAHVPTILGVVTARALRRSLLLVMALLASTATAVSAVAHGDAHVHEAAAAVPAAPTGWQPGPETHDHRNAHAALHLGMWSRESSRSPLVAADRFDAGIAADVTPQLAAVAPRATPSPPSGQSRASPSSRTGAPPPVRGPPHA